MEQTPIRPYGGKQYTVDEAAAIFAEIEARTGSDVNGLNSIDEIAQRVLPVASCLTLPTTSGTLTIDNALAQAYNVTLIGVTTIALANMPSANQGATFVIKINGDYTLNLPNELTTGPSVVVGEYDGTKDNLITISAFAGVYWTTIINAG